MLENGFCEIGQKIRGRAEFHGAAQNSARLRVFLSIFQDFGLCKIHSPNQPN